jgi:DNA-binding NarL/FixJ family response regulator
MTPEEKERYLNGEMIYENTGRTRRIVDYPLSLMTKDEKRMWRSNDPEQQLEVKKQMAADGRRKIKDEPIRVTIERGYLNDPYDLVSTGKRETTSTMERVYADYANKCKELGNKARKAYLEIDTPRADPAATKEYAEEVASLKSKLVQAQLNAPLERLAQVRGNETIKKMKKSGDSKYDSYSNADWKKEKGKALERARRDVGAKKAQIDITEKEWEAIQNRAVSPSLLKEILDNADLDKIREYAMPKNEKPISLKMESRIKAYAASGKTQAEIAEALGISATTVNKVLT